MIYRSLYVSYNLRTLTKFCVDFIKKNKILKKKPAIKQEIVPKRQRELTKSESIL